MVVLLIFLEEQRAASSHDRIVGWDMEETLVVAVPTICLPQSFIFFFSGFNLTHDLPHLSLPKTKKMAEDLFDGAIGIDLGTTYSYESKF